VSIERDLETQPRALSIETFICRGKSSVLSDSRSFCVLQRLVVAPEVLALLPSAEARANVRIAHKDWELQNK